MRWRWPPENSCGKLRICWRCRPDLVEQVRDALLFFPAVGNAVDQQRLADDVAGRHARIERGKRVLKDDLHLPAMRPHSGFAETA